MRQTAFHRFRQQATIKTTLEGSGQKELEIKPQSYVNNQGLTNEVEQNLIELQLDGAKWLGSDLRHIRSLPSSWLSRLAMIAWVRRGDSTLIPTQALLEKGTNPTPRKSWNVNYMSHGWHRYVGRFPPQIVRAIFNAFRIACPQVVLDPFCGSGTTLVEAKLMGIDAIGVEICPLSQLIASVKSRLDFPHKRLTTALASVESKFGHFGQIKFDNSEHANSMRSSNYKIPDFPNKDRWFNGDVLFQLNSLLSAIQELDDELAKKFFLVAVSGTMRRIANVDVDVVRTEYRRTPRRNVNVLETVKQRIFRMARDLCTYARMQIPQADVECRLGDARKLSLPSSSMDLVITSPPYGIEAISYLRTHMLSYRVLAPILKMDYDDLAKKMIGTEFVLDWNLNRTDLISSTATRFFNSFGSDSTRQTSNRLAQMIQYYQDFEKVFSEVARVLRDRGHAVFVIGNKSLLGKTLPTNKIFQETAEHFGLRMRTDIKAKLICNNPTSRTPWSHRMIANEHILLFSKS